MSSNPSNHMSSGSSPIKRTAQSSLSFESSPLADYSSNRARMSKEMEGYWIGPMPVQDFIEEFLKLPPGMPSPPERPKLFSKLKVQTVEKKMYAPFIRVITRASPKLIPGFKIIDTSSHPDLESRAGKKLKPDPSMYRSEVSTSIKVTQFDKLELNFEFKLADTHDPFRDPESPDVDRTTFNFEAGTITSGEIRGQLTSYATEWCSRQHRTFAFTVFIFGTYARLIRWDRSGAIVTEKFNYKQNSQPLVDFLWYFTRLDDAGRGKDSTVRAATPDETKIAHEKLKEWEPTKKRNVIVFTIMDGSEERDFIGWGSMADAESLRGRATRAYPVWDTKMKAIRFLKDSWRGVNFEPESDILRTLNAAKVDNVPQLICGGDISGYGHTTRSYEFAANFTDEAARLKRMPWKCGMHNIVQRIHHHFVGKEVGLKLEGFGTSKDLMTVVYDAFIAHRQAYEICNILHRDISARNVMMKSDGKGFLNDWDLAKRIIRGAEEAPRDHERTGTWQFISTLNLLKPGKFHNAQDDMESFVHLVLYHGLRFIQHTPLNNLRDTMIRVFDDYSVDHNGTQRGGLGKKAMFLNRDHIGPEFEFTGNIPLTFWLNFAMDAVKQWINYEMPPTQPQRNPYNDPDLDNLGVTPLQPPSPQINPALLVLKDHQRFAEVWKRLLAHPKWPTNDKTTDQVPPTTAKSLAASTKRARNEAELESSNKKMRSMASGSQRSLGQGSALRQSHTPDRR